MVIYKKISKVVVKKGATALITNTAMNAVLNTFSMNEVKWGIIGCGDVTEIKSGPAFNKVPQSSLVAVMRRDGAKASDYARRHHVPRWYDNAMHLLDDPGVNAIYVSTPPSSHEQYTIEALKRGKPVYVEKPMSLDTDSCIRMANAARETGTKLTVAHYRRAVPVFKKVKELIDSGAIGRIRFADMHFYQPALDETMTKPDNNWRINPEISGGGIFHDLAPHLLDLMYHYFGPVKHASGVARNQMSLYNADDIVSGQILFNSGVIFNGLWCFSVPAAEARDECIIMGTEGKITFSVFGHVCRLSTGSQSQVFEFKAPEHIQQPMIQQVTEYFLNSGPNPCPPAEAVEVMKLMDIFTSKENF